MLFILPIFFAFFLLLLAGTCEYMQALYLIDCLAFFILECALAFDPVNLENNRMFEHPVLTNVLVTKQKISFNLWL